MSEQARLITEVHPLYQYFSDLCRTHRTGLAPIEMNAGGGKSYQMDHFIAEGVTKGYRFMILCPAKKILEQSREDLEKLGLQEGVGKDIVWIRSQEDTARIFFEEKDNKTFRLPTNFGDRQAEFNEAIEAYHVAFQNIDGSASFSGPLREKVERETREHLHATVWELNRVIRSIGLARYADYKEELIHDEKLSPKKAREQVVKRILADRDFAFLKWYCPLLYAADAPVILMTRTKADFRISDPFYVTSFADSRIVQNRVIFMDEEDACKAMTEETYIDHMDRNSINLLSLMMRLDMYLGEHAQGRDLRIFMRHSDGKALDEEQSRKCEELKHFFERLQQAYQRMQRDWNFMESYYPDEALLSKEDASRRFLIRSQYTGDARDSKSKPLYVYACDGRNVISVSDQEEKRSGWRQLKSSRRQNPNYAGRLDTFAEEMAWLVKQLLNFIRRLSLFYCDLTQDLNVEDVQERIVKQLLQSDPAPGKHDPLQLFLLDNLYGSLYSDGAKRSGVLGDNFFDNGLHLVMLHKEEGERPYDMQCYMCSDTPEKELCALAEKTLVIAISATAGIDSDICNYDFGYARERLGENFLEMPESVKNALWDYEREHCHYREAGVRNSVRILDLTTPFSLAELLLPDEDYWQAAGKVKDREACLTFITDIRSSLCGIGNPKAERQKMTWEDWQKQMNVEEPWVVRRILCCLAVFKEYLQLVEREKHDKSDPNRVSRGVDSALCILNRMPKAESFAILADMMSKMCGVYKAESKDYPLRTISGSEQEVQKAKDAIDADFDRDMHPFVVTAFNACGYATNLQHLTKVNSSDLVKIRSDREWKDRRKDYDLLFLDEPTNVIPNIHDRKLSENAWNRQILHLEYISSELYESGEIAMSHASPRTLYKHAKDSDAYLRAVAKTLLQAAARIQRTCVKSYNTMYILPKLKDGKVIPALTTMVDCREHIVGVETEGLIRGLQEIAFREQGEDPETLEQRRLTNEVTRICRRFDHSRERLLHLVRHKPTEEIRKQWNSVRHQCLHTYLTREEYEALPEIEKRCYILLPENVRGKIHGYWYRKIVSKNEEDWPDEAYDAIEVWFQDETPKGEGWHRMDETYYRGKDLLSLDIPACDIHIGALLKDLGLPETMIGEDAYAVLHPQAAQEYLLGVLGEITGHYLLEKIFDMTPEEMEIEHLEVMDEKLTLGHHTLYIDYKNWQHLYTENDKMREPVERKAATLQAETLLYLLPVKFKAPKKPGLYREKSLGPKTCEVYTGEGLVYLDHGKWCFNMPLALGLVRLKQRKENDETENEDHAERTGK